MSFVNRQLGRFLASTFVAACGLLLVSCAGTRPDAPATSAAPQPYTRIARPDTNTVQLQIAVRKFVPVKHHGPVIWLAGASHIGDPDYYHALQRQLDAQTIVLFEGVNTDSHKRHARLPRRPPVAAAPAKPAAENDPPGIQSTLAESMGLVFQLDAIDYDRTNFLNSDLSIQEIQRLMGGPEQTASLPSAPVAQGGGPGTTNASFNYLMQAMDGSSFVGAIMKVAVQFLGSSSSLRAITKFTFIETLGQLKGDLTAIRGMPPDMQQLLKVLIEARNQNVIEDLKTESRRVPRPGSIAVFYGTGHMEDMEKRLCRELNYRPAEDIWLTAFSVDLRQTGLSATQLQMVQNLVKWQMNQMQP